jgi:hypothetical protein
MHKKQASGYNPYLRYGKRDSSTSGTGSPHNGTSSVQSQNFRKDCTPNVRPNNLPPCPASPLGHFLCPHGLLLSFSVVCFANLSATGIGREGDEPLNPT